AHSNRSLPCREHITQIPFVTSFGPERYRESALSPVMISPRRLIVLSEIFMWPLMFLSHLRAQSFRPCLLALIRVLGQCLLVVCQIREESETSNTIGGDSLTVDSRVTAQQVAQVI